MESTLTWILGLLTVSDPLRQDAAATMARLQAMGLELCLLSGDRRAAVEHLAHRVGLGPQAVIADTRPQGKGQVIEDLRTQGRCVAMVAAPMAAVPIANGRFQQGVAAEHLLHGRFHGPGHAEAWGLFHTDAFLAAFGAARQQQAPAAQ